MHHKLIEHDHYSLSLTFCCILFCDNNYIHITHGTITPPTFHIFPNQFQIPGPFQVFQLSGQHVNCPPYLYTAKHQVQKQNSMSKRIVTEVTEDVEKTEVSDGSIALCCGDYLIINAVHLHRPRQEPIHSRSAVR